MADAFLVTPARRRRMAIVAVALALQIGVAGFALTQERPGRYGWQMYSAQADVPRVWAVEASDLREVSITDAVITPRSEIDWRALVLEHGCDLVDADEVRYELRDGTRGSLAC